MGTSISQGSSGSIWTEFKRAVNKNTITPSHMLGKVLHTYKAQYQEKTVDLLVDKGVQLIEELVTSFEGCDLALFYQKGRRALALSGTNSVFADLALTSAASILSLKPKEPHSPFIIKYLSHLVDYTLSRDLPELLGTQGVPTLYSFRILRTEVNKAISRMRFEGILKYIVLQILENDYVYDLSEVKPHEIEHRSGYTGIQEIVHCPDAPEHREYIVVYKEGEILTCFRDGTSVHDVCRRPEFVYV